MLAHNKITHETTAIMNLKVFISPRTTTAAKILNNNPIADSTIATIENALTVFFANMN